jgi:hypothetical protein
MKNKLLLVSSLATALSAMTAGAITYITPLLDSSQYAQKTGGTDNSLASNWKLLQSIPGLDLSAPGTIYDVPLSSYTFVPPGGDRYAVLHYGAGPAGGGGVSPGGYWQVVGVYDGGTIPTTATLPNGQRVGALSSFRGVPDGGSTVMLLGAALSVIAVARRKFGV